MEEVWIDIKEYEGYYQISNLGRVRSLDRLVKHSDGHERKQFGKILKPIFDVGGYQYIALHKNANGKMFKVHRLVALAFIPNINNKLEINHLDEDKKNNKAENLEWCTRLENEHWGTKRERCMHNTDYKSIAVKNSKAVIQLDLDNNIVFVWDSLAQIHKTLGYSQGNISMCCNGKYNKPLYGYNWRYKEVM